MLSENVSNSILEFVLKILCLLAVVLVYCVVDGENVFWVQALLHAFEQGVVQSTVGLIHESLSELADTMMM